MLFKWLGKVNMGKKGCEDNKKSLLVKDHIHLARREDQQNMSCTYERLIIAIIMMIIITGKTTIWELKYKETKEDCSVKNG